MTHKFLPRRRLHVVGVGISVLKSVSTLGEQCRCVKKVLPVDPGAAAAHHLLVDPTLDLGKRLGLKLHTLGMVLPLKKIKHRYYVTVKRTACL